MGAKGPLSLLITMLISHGVLAQDICSGILAYTGRDVISEARENSVAAEIYNQHCEGSSAKGSSSTSVGLEAVVKAIPIKFSFGGASAQEKLNSFCKVYTARRAEFSAENIDRSIVVREALSAFNECVSLSTKGIFFHPKIGRTSLVVDVRRGSDDASITGVAYDPDLMTCRFPPTSGAAATVADRDAVRSLDGNFLPITCDRKSVAGPNGERNYPRIEMIIATSRGSLFIPVAPDALMPLQWASDMSQRVSSVEQRVDAADVQSKDLSARVGMTTGQDLYLCPDNQGRSGGSLGGGDWGYYGCQGQVTSQATCTVIEYPRSQSYQCARVGKLRIAP